MKRRAFLKAAAAAPLGAQVAGQELALRAAGVTGIGGAIADSSYGVPVGESSDGPKRFTDFAKWLMAGGEREIRERAERVEKIDPDLLCLHVPLWTKMQWQRDRNLERERARMRERFTRAVDGEGFFRWYF